MADPTRVNDRARNELGEKPHLDMEDHHRAYFEPLSVNQLKQIIRAATYLDVVSLHAYALQVGAQRMMGKSADEVRAEWGLPDDLSWPEKEEIYRRNRTN